MRSLAFNVDTHEGRFLDLILIEDPGLPIVLLA